MAECIKREADRFKYYIVRNKITGEYFRGKGVNKWGKYYNQASIYRFRKHAEDAVEEETRRGRPSEVIEIRITTDDVVEVVLARWEKIHDDPRVNKYRCTNCKSEKMRDNYCPNCGAKMDGVTDNNVGDKRW